MSPLDLLLWPLALLVAVVCVALVVLIVWALLDLARDGIKAKARVRKHLSIAAEATHEA